MSITHQCPIQHIRIQHSHSIVSFCVYLHSTQGKGLMNTYWLTCREGPSKKREEIAWYADIEPIFMQQMRHDIKPRKKSAKL